jgi:hypothetical protein
MDSQVNGSFGLQISSPWCLCRTSLSRFPQIIQPKLRSRPDQAHLSVWNHVVDALGSGLQTGWWIWSAPTRSGRWMPR